VAVGDDVTRTESDRPVALLRPRRTGANTGTYANDLYGPTTVSAQGDDVIMQLGPKKQRFTLRHHDGGT
jgi:hypothetical protein